MDTSASEALRNRFSRTLSIYGDTDTETAVKPTTNGESTGSGQQEYKYSSGYVRYQYSRNMALTAQCTVLKYEIY